MSEHLEHGQHDSSPEPSDHLVDAALTDDAGPQEEPAQMTGHPAVDEVLQSMQGLQERPVEEHVAIFEAAHEKLRAALANAGDRPNGPAGS
ncbi:MAG TPA: hypothetical protein VFR87_19550 [Nocardioidaceae bacterium]|nr:hypothetical protein [Nocardioidaceae bacterium]